MKTIAITLIILSALFVGFSIKADTIYMTEAEWVEYVQWALDYTAVPEISEDTVSWVESYDLEYQELAQTIWDTYVGDPSLLDDSGYDMLDGILLADKKIKSYEIQNWRQTQSEKRV
jgi:hypothetical protein